MHQRHLKKAKDLYEQAHVWDMQEPGREGRIEVTVATMHGYMENVQNQNVGRKRAGIHVFHYSACKRLRTIHKHRCEDYQVTVAMQNHIIRSALKLDFV